VRGGANQPAIVVLALLNSGGGNVMLGKRPLCRRGPSLTSLITSTKPAPSALEARLPLTPGTSRLRIGPLAAATASTAFLISVAGGYLGNWAWTGYKSNGTVWDWLHLLLIPLSISALPIWWRHEPAARRYLSWAGGAAVIALTILVAGGYGWNWNWTGFAGNYLWEWLNLLLLPLVVALIPLWLRSRIAHRDVWIAAMAGAAAMLTVLILGGYGLNWSWTGFAGNSLWDWIHLLLVPLVLPASLAWLDDRQHELRMLRAAAARHHAELASQESG
jgi:hypothetical protein